MIGALVLRELRLAFARGGALPPPSARPKPAPSFDGPLGTVHAALISMGFKPNEAEQAVQKVGAQADGKEPEDLLREALSVLS